MGRYLRAKTYLLCSKIEVKRFFNYSLKRQQRIEPVAEPIAHEKIMAELQSLSAEFLLFKMKSLFGLLCSDKEDPKYSS